MKPKNKLKIDPQIRNASKEMLNGLVQLSTSPHYKHIGALIRLIKQNLLLDEFSYPASDPVKNALNKEYCKGIDKGLSLLANTIKDAGNLADSLEENG